MAENLTVPAPWYALDYNRRDITADVAPYVLSIAYTDYLGGQSDELEVVLENVDGRWQDAWYPGKGDTLTAVLGYAEEGRLAAGDFEIDEITLAFDPASTVSLRALSAGIGKAVRTRKGRAYEDTTLQAIAADIARRHRLKLTGLLKDIPVSRATQYQERDVEFLTRLAREHGYCFKIAGDQLAFTELAELKAAPPVRTLQLADIRGGTLTDKIKDIYAGAEVVYQNPRSGELVSHAVQAMVDDAFAGKATSADTLRLAARAESPAEAEAKAKAALEQANLPACGGRLDLEGDPRLVAGVTVELQGLGRLSGTYLIESANHVIERGGGYSLSIAIKRVKS